MRNSVVCVVVLLVLAALVSASPAQTAEELNAQAKWMSAWAGWMSAAGQNNVQVKMVEAEAKLIAAQAAMVTAAAGANKTNAEAFYAREQARSLVMDNSLKKADVFYKKRALHSNAGLLNPRVRPTREDAVRYSQARVPDRLLKSQFDPDRGRIHWPLVLQGDQFFECRIQLEVLLVESIERDQEFPQQVQDLTKEMQAELHPLVHEVSSAEYIKARRFIRSLAYEARFPTQIEGLAANR